MLSSGTLDGLLHLLAASLPAKDSGGMLCQTQARTDWLIPSSIAYSFLQCFCLSTANPFLQCFCRTTANPFLQCFRLSTANSFLQCFCLSTANSFLQCFCLSTADSSLQCFCLSGGEITACGLACCFCADSCVKRLLANQVMSDVQAKHRTAFELYCSI